MKLDKIMYPESYTRRVLFDIVQMVQRLDQKEIGLIVLNLTILNHGLGDPNLQKLIRNMLVQLLSWTA